MAKIEKMCTKTMFVITTIMLSLVVLIAYLKKIKNTEGMSSGASQSNSGNAVFHNSRNSANESAKYSALGNDQQPSQRQYSLIQGREKTYYKDYFTEETQIAKLKAEIQDMEKSTSGYSSELAELRKQLKNIAKKYDAAHASSIKSAADTTLAMEKYETYKRHYVTYKKQPSAAEAKLKASGKALSLAKAHAIASAKESHSKQNELLTKAEMQLKKVEEDLSKKDETLKGLITSSQKGKHETEHVILGKHAALARIYKHIAAGREREEVNRMNQLNSIPVAASQSTLMDRMMRGSNVGTMMQGVSLGNDDNVTLFRMGETNSYILVDTDNYGPSSTNFQQNPNQTIGPQSLGLGNMNVNVKMTHKLSPELNSQLNQGITTMNQTVN